MGIPPATMNAPAIQSTIDSLRAFYTIILALAIGEAFKQFVVDRAQKPEERHIQWDRLPALLSFLLLIVPFYHGMLRYFFDVYARVPRPAPYGLWLGVDCMAFTVEAILFFVLSRSLSLLQWRTFYTTVVVLFGFDCLWTSCISIAHGPVFLSWILLDIGALVGFGVILLCLRNYKPDISRWRGLPGLLPVLVIFLRTAIDYGVNCSFYFPPQDPVISAVSPSAQTVTVTNTNKRIYFAAPLFTQAEWQWNNRLSAELAKLNFEVILPQRSAEPMLQGSRPFNASALFSLNREEIDRADLVLAVLDEADADSGTSWECGYAYKSGRPILGLRTDIRRTGDDPNASVNLMLSQSCKQLIQVPLQRINDLSWVAQKIADSANAILR